MLFYLLPSYHRAGNPAWGGWYSWCLPPSLHFCLFFSSSPPSLRIESHQTAHFFFLPETLSFLSRRAATPGSRLQSRKNYLFCILGETLSPGCSRHAFFKWSSNLKTPFDKAWFATQLPCWQLKQRSNLTVKAEKWPPGYRSRYLLFPEAPKHFISKDSELRQRLETCRKNGAIISVAGVAEGRCGHSPSCCGYLNRLCTRRSLFTLSQCLGSPPFLSKCSERSRFPGKTVKMWVSQALWWEIAGYLS